MGIINSIVSRINSMKILLFSFLIFNLLAFSQNDLTYNIEWENPIIFKVNNKEVYLPKIKNQGYNIDKPMFELKEKTQLNSNVSFSLTNVVTEKALKKESDYVNHFLLNDLYDSVQFQAKVVYAGKEKFISVSLFPFLLKNGEVNRIVSFSLKIKDAPSEKKSKSLKSNVSNSVLSSGQWYKISLNKDGVYKIDKSFLESCGINTNNLNPNHIHIYGNGEGRLPELNSEYRTDDLAQNAIFIVGGEDNQFDKDDYILFNAWGPDRWYENSGKFYNDKNIYSDQSYYFITINSNITPLLISTLNSNDNVIINYQTTTYSYYDSHESDLYSLVAGGQRWYGELFDTELNRTFQFNIPNVDNTSSINFDVAIASNASVASGTNQTFSINGQNLYSSTLPVGDFSRKTFSFTYDSPISSFDLDVSVTRNSPTVLTYLDFITLNARRSLVYAGSQFNFRDLNSVFTGQWSKFTVSTSNSSFKVWDVSNRHSPKIIVGSFLANDFSFIIDTDSLREFVAFDILSTYSPVFVEIVKNQNLHALEQADYLIVTHENFKSQAERLANLHRETGLIVHVVTTKEIFNEFSSGSLDPTAIKDFVKMFYNRYKLNNNTIQPKYLLLFGDGTYDPKNRVPNNNNYVPTYQVLNSEYDLSAMVTDDYFGMLDDNESISSSDMLDIGVGRLLVSDLNTAKQQVDKIEHYLKNGSNLFSNVVGQCTSNSENEVFGDWRNKYVIIADDEESGYFINQDAEPNSIYVKENFPEMNCDKLYLDAFKQISNAGGQRYPDVENLITKRVESGALVVNYIGHGGESGAAEERIITIPQIQSWLNIDKLNLFVSATCEFTKFDDPSRLSAGELVSLNRNGGAIALMTTTRSVFFGVNTITGKKFYENVFSRDSNGLPLRFGDILMKTKNASGSSDNKRSFTLIGDPALRIALPTYKVVTDSINGFSVNDKIDTLRALSKVRIKGHIEDLNGVPLTSFQGILQPTIFDKVKNQSTLGQDSDSPIISFETQKNALYRGKSSIVNGAFDFSFIVPKDINYSYGAGKLSYYGNDLLSDAQGQDTNFIVGGIDSSGVDDNVGPDIKLYFNNENFVDGGLTSETPTLIVKLYDESGINTVGNGIGHDITLVIDGKTASPIVLNEYYSSDIDSYQSGGITYVLDKLDAGMHNLKFKVWDVNNNSSEVSLDFTVQESLDLALKHVLNYPNPFTTNTDFYFEHNQICNELDVQIQVFTVSGKLIKTIQQKVNASGFRSEGINWDGLDDYGDQIGRGVYLYKLTVKSEDGKTADKIEKLVILR